MKSMYKSPARSFIWTLHILFLALAFAGCRSGPDALVGALPDADVLPGWQTAGSAEVFDYENLYDLVNGQADAFFAYGFERVVVQNYENAEGAVVGLEIWQLATPADAYGLFTASIAGAPVAIGNAGDADLGRRLAFWQDRYYVRVLARQELPQTDLRRFGESISAALPAGGEPPPLTDRLPPQGLVERSALFFHQEISIQNTLWLGGENLLRLSPETDGVLAQYDVDGARAHLLLVQYPDEEGASAGLTALEGSPIDGPVAADARDNLLGAVFGSVDRATASTLLTEALDEE